MKILVNDWPYGLTPDIKHLVVWTKTPIPTSGDPADNDDITPAARAKIKDFVATVFSSVVRGKNVLWFKNWKSLQSVPSVEHVHVLVRGASEELVRSWVEGPWGSKIKR